QLQEPSKRHHTCRRRSDAVADTRGAFHAQTHRPRTASEIRSSSGRAPSMHLRNFLVFRGLDSHGIALKQRLIKLIGRFDTLDIEPLSTDFVVNLRECRKAALPAFDDVDHMCSIAGVDGSLPSSGRYSRKARSELLAKRF